MFQTDWMLLSQFMRDTQMWDKYISDIYFISSVCVAQRLTYQEKMLEDKIDSSSLRDEPLRSLFHVKFTVD